MAVLWATVSAFVPSPHVRHHYFPSASGKTVEVETPVCLPLYASKSSDTMDTLDSTVIGESRNTMRSTAPVVLVGSDTAVLETFAKHLMDHSASEEVIDLADVAQRDGALGMKRALAGSKSGGILVCPSTLCLGYPGVNDLMRSHPLTIHLAIEGEDLAVRQRCEVATRYTVVIHGGIEEEARAKTDLSRLVSFARKPRPSPQDVALDMGKNTFFLSLTFDDFAPHESLLPDLTEGVDAMELRVDLLADHDPYSVLRQLSILRRYTGYLPIVYTIRSKGQCGAFPDDPEMLFRLARWGLRGGCEVMDVEANWPMSYREGLIQEAKNDYPGAVLVGSYHVVGRKTTENQARKLFMDCYHDGAVDGVKVRECIFAFLQRKCHHENGVRYTLL